MALCRGKSYRSEIFFWDLILSKQKTNKTVPNKPQKFRRNLSTADIMVLKPTLLLASLMGLASATCSHDNCYGGMFLWIWHQKSSLCTLVDLSQDITGQKDRGITDCEAYLEVTYIAPTTYVNSITKFKKKKKSK